VGEIEADAFRGDPIDRWSGHRSTVTAERVSAQRIDGEEKNVLIGDRMQVGLRSGTSQTECEERDRDSRDCDYCSTT